MASLEFARPLFRDEGESTQGDQTTQTGVFIRSTRRYADDADLRVWRMNINPNDQAARRYDSFQREYQNRVARKAYDEVGQLKSMKLSFAMQVDLSKPRQDGETETMKRFHETRSFIVNRTNRGEIRQMFEDFIAMAQEEMDDWSMNGSGWNMDGVSIMYVNTAKYDPVLVGEYIPTPPKLANKKAVVNVKNKDNECLKWAVRASLYPVAKNAERPSSYPQKDGIDYSGIDFPTPLKQIDKLERQNPGFAFTVLGWEEDRVTVHRLSEREGAKEVVLILLEDGERQHFACVRRLSALLFDKRLNNKSHYCLRCLSRFTTEKTLQEHKKWCQGQHKKPQRVELPEEGKNELEFKNFKKQLEKPYVIYADFEALVVPQEGERGSKTEMESKNEACGYSYLVMRKDGEIVGSGTGRSKRASEAFLGSIMDEEADIRKAIANPAKPKMEKEDWIFFNSAKNCAVCEKSLMVENFLDSNPSHDAKTGTYRGQSHKKCHYKHLERMGQDFRKAVMPHLKDEFDKWVAENQEDCFYCGDPLLWPKYRDAARLHCDLTGEYTGAAHSSCKAKLRENARKEEIPVLFHNLKNYDSHILMQGFSTVNREIKPIASNMESYKTIKMGGLLFIDSLAFLSASLDSLVESTPKEDLVITKRLAARDLVDSPVEVTRRAKLLFKKGVYPYEYMDSWERFEETCLPPKEKFYSKLSGKHITDKEYAHAQEIWREFDCETLADYHNLYVETDVTLLADVFEGFRTLCMEKYGLDPAHYKSAPALSWDALLKKTGVKLELLTDIDMHLFIESGMRGGISQTSKRYARANNPLVEGYDPQKPTTHIMYLDANNLYGCAMSMPLPKGGFKWKTVMPTEEQILKKKEKAKQGWILEVDLEYPENLHADHSSYPLAPEKKAVEEEWLSPYQQRLMKELGLKHSKEKKMLLTLQDKTNYVTHYRNLQLYLKLGMRLKKVHKVLEFDQEAWMEPYIRMNTELRKKASSKFEKDFFKLMNNSVFGKTMENLRNRVDIKVVRTKDKRAIRKLVASPRYERFKLFANDMAGIEMSKSRLVLDKPIYAGMTILENSKIVMYDFFYNVLRARYGRKCELLYTDTDSLLLEVETEDFYSDMAERMDLYDTSDYPADHPLHSDANKKVLGKMKDECAGVPIAEYVGLRPKMYSIMRADSENIRKAKGVKRCVIKKEMTHQTYKEALFERKQQEHEMHILRSEAHEIFGVKIKKTSLSPMDTKRWIEEDGVHTKAYGHTTAPAKLYEELEGFLSELLQEK